MSSRVLYLNLAAAVFVVCASSCAARLSVTDLYDVQPGQGVDGVPFRIRETQEVVVYQRQTDGTYEAVHRQYKDLPNMDELYALNMHADAFSKGTLKVVLNGDGTLSSADTSSAVLGTTALTNLSTQLDSIATQIAGFDKKREDTKKTREDARVLGLTNELTAEYNRVFEAIVDAERDMRAGVGNWTKDEINKLIQKANEIGVRIGKSEIPPLE